VRELRVGKYRVFYDVDEPAQRVIVRAIRAKPPGRTTEEIL
jgi:mRNA-degrading endonuclease RelE of RelBE toxin-antitoxin system